MDSKTSPTNRAYLRLLLVKEGLLAGKLKEDSWPDFELLIKAKRNNLKILEVPIHYKARKEAISKMKTFRHDYQMLKMLGRSFRGVD